MIRSRGGWKGVRFWLLVSCLLARSENGVEGRGEGETDAGDIKEQGGGRKKVMYDADLTLVSQDRRRRGKNKK